MEVRKNDRSMDHTNARSKRKGLRAIVAVGRVRPAMLRYHPRHQDRQR